MEIKIDPQTNTLIREGIENIINPFDSYAIEEGVRIKERFNDEEVEVIALTMGPPQSVEILKEAISVGVDSAILLSDRAFAGADTWATSTTLAKATDETIKSNEATCACNVFSLLLSPSYRKEYVYITGLF